MSPPADPIPQVDPSLPDLDASWDPSPGQPSEKIPGASSSSSGATSSSSSSSSSSSNGGPQPKTDEDDDAGSSGTIIVTATKPAQGEVVISEVMYDPSTVEPPSEWIEIHNVSSAPKLLTGLTIVDGGNRTHTIAGGSVVVQPGAYVVLVRSTAAATAAKVPATAIVYEYGAGLADNVGVQLANGTTGGVQLKDGTTTIAQADYGGWFAASAGSSVQLKTMTFAAAAQSGNWCLASNVWTTGADKGTPGGPNNCP